MDEINLQLMRVAIDVAYKARENGNHPFGAILVDEQNKILMVAENTVITENDCTCHAETNLVRQASRKYTREILSKCALYASTEPCPMCAGAILWSNIGRLVFGVSQSRFYEMVGKDSSEALLLSCRDVFEKGNKQIEIIGPILEDEALIVHRDFW